ncbi:hypothetical protein ACHAQA_000191 [Verticillium albo-atrum]
MRFSQCAPLLLGTLASAVGVVADDSNIIAGAYIVELDDGAADAAALYDELRADGIEVQPSMDLKFRLFNGVSFRVDSPDDVDTDALTAKIAAKGTVKALWPVRGIRFPKLDPSAVARNGSAPASVHAARGGFGRRAFDEVDTFSPHVMTQVDKLRAEGITGKGFRIGVVDTGIDYRHPALGGCFGEGCLVTHGWDFAGDEFDEGGNLKPDADPLDTCQGHGTHVSGIVAAQENELGFTGAAPDVTIGAYKTSGCAGYANSEVLVAGIYRAYEEGADIITLSAGDDSGWSTDAAADAVSRLAAAGVPVLVATGNSGGLGVWNAASPASGKEVAAVGSVDNTFLPTIMTRGEFSNGTDDEGFGWMEGNPILQTNATLRLWAPTNATDLSSYACTSVPADMPELDGAIALLEAASECGSDDQANNIVARGGKHVIFYPAEGRPLSASWVFSEGIEGALTVSRPQAAAWIKAIKAGQKIDITVAPVDSSRVFAEPLSNGPGAGLTSGFSSWGPSWEVVLKPQFTAPGGGILSTWTFGQGDYAVHPGTSMSTPLVAGIYALVGQVRKTLNAQVLRNVLASTAKPLPWFDGETTHEDILAPVPQQGAGMVQAYDAAYATTLVDTSGFSFNDTDNFTPERTFTIENTASEAVTYTLGHAKAVTVYTFDPENLSSIARFPPPTVDEWASVAFAEDTVTIPAGGSAKITFTLTAPSGLDGKRLPVYSGYITITPTGSDDKPRLTLPYLGVAGSLHEARVLHTDPVPHTGVYLSSTANHFLIPVPANETFTVPRPGGTWAPSTLPKIVAIPTVGTPELHVDLVAVGGSGSNASSVATRDWLGFESLGNLPRTPVYFAPTIGYTHNFDGRLADGTVVPEGAYKFVVSALRIFGDREEKSDWVVVESVPFVLRYLNSKCKRVLLDASEV